MAASSYGVTNAGFAAKPVAAILSDLQQGVLSSAVFGATFDVSPDGPMGQLLGVLAQPIGDVWQLAQAVYSSLDPDQASGQALVGLCALTGVSPLGALPSTGLEVFVGTNTAVVSGGTLLADSTTGVQFSVDNPITITTLAAWVTLTSYSTGAMVHDGANVYFAVIGGGISGSTSPSTAVWTGSTYLDGSVTWFNCGAGSAAASQTITSVNTGAFPSAQGNLTVVVTPVYGLSSAVNPYVIVLGQTVESDSALRIRRNEELSAGGSATVNAILADLLLLTGVTNAAVFDNPTDSTNGAGLPPHSIEAVVLGGTTQAILNQLYLSSVAAGVAIYGTTTGTVVDSQGFSHSSAFTRPTSVPIYISAVITTNSNYPANGAAQIKAILVAFAAGQVANGASGVFFPPLSMGNNVVASMLYAPIWQIAGVAGITSVYVGTSASPVGSSVTISITQIASVAIGTILVNGS